MAKDLNKVMLTGYLGADPEMRYTPQGSAVTTFRVASGRTWKSADGTQHDDTEWFRIVAWDKLGEICNQYLTKGRQIYIEGTSPSGGERPTTERMRPPTTGSGRPVTAASSIPGSRRIASSTSVGSTLRPPRSIWCLVRPWM